MGQLPVYQHSTVVISAPVYLVQTNPVEYQQASLKFNDMRATADRTTDHDMKQSYRLRKAVNQILLSRYGKKVPVTSVLAVCILSHQAPPRCTRNTKYLQI